MGILCCLLRAVMGKLFVVVIIMREMMTRCLTWSLLVCVSLLSNACLVTPERFQTLQQDVRRLRADLNTLAKNRTANEERLRRIEGELMGVEGGTSQVTDVVARLEELAVETRMVQGKVEENSYYLSELGQRLDETERLVAHLRGDTRGPGETSRVRQPPIPSAVSPLPFPTGAPRVPSAKGQPLPPRRGGLSSPRSPSAAAPGPPVIQGPLPSPEEVYRKALTDYTKGNYDLAISSFKTYLTYFPKTSLVPNAQYWLAESYYSQRKYANAIREFDALITDYPDSSRVPSAMLKKGYAYLELKETAFGQGVLRELMAKFPRSREARLAQDSLDRLE